MKVYLGGAPFIGIFKRIKVPRVLLSYFGLHEKHLKIVKGMDIFIDSGGYSAQNSGKKVNIFEYGDFLTKYEPLFTAYANLDIDNFTETQNNQKYLESLGLDPLPVYHLFDFNSENKNLIVDFCNSYEYICVGGLVGRRGQKKEKSFFEYCFKIAEETNTKVHGFGVTDFKNMMKYPFYSVDSTSWTFIGRSVSFHQLENHSSVMTITNLRKGNTKNSFLNADYYRKMEWNALQWKELSEILERKGGYWNGDA